MTFRDRLPFRKRVSSDLAPIFNIQQQMNDIFDGFFKNWNDFPSFSSSNRFPSLNVFETDKEICIKAEIPGLEEKDVKIEVDQDQLTIRGEKKTQTEDKDKEGAYWMKEISYGNFSRVISLPFQINPEKAKASFSKGILTLTIEKPAESISKVKTIPITHQ